MSKIVLAMSMQYDHLPGGALPIIGLDTLLVPIRAYISRLDDEDIVIAGREWHPDNHFSFYEPHDGHEPFPEHCVQGTKGARIFPAINRYCDYVLSYGTGRNEEGYSAFEGKTLRPVMSLEDILVMSDIRTVEVIGGRLEVEVARTAFDANAAGLDTTVIAHLTDAPYRTKEAVQDTVKKFNKAGVKYE